MRCTKVLRSLSGTCLTELAGLGNELSMGFKKKRIKDNSKDAIPYDQEVKSVGKILQLLLDDGIV